jgi:hypothetical protein
MLKMADEKKDILASEEGELIYTGSNPARVEFELTPKKGRIITSIRRIDVSRSMLPADYDPSVYRVHGSYVLEIKLEKIPKK